MGRDVLTHIDTLRESCQESFIDCPPQLLQQLLPLLRRPIPFLNRKTPTKSLIDPLAIPPKSGRNADIVGI